MVYFSCLCQDREDTKEKLCITSGKPPSTWTEELLLSPRETAGFQLHSTNLLNLPVDQTLVVFTSHFTHVDLTVLCYVLLHPIIFCGCSVTYTTMCTVCIQAKHVLVLNLVILSTST